MGLSSTSRRKSVPPSSTLQIGRSRSSTQATETRRPLSHRFVRQSMSSQMPLALISIISGPRATSSPSLLRATLSHTWGLSQYGDEQFLAYHAARACSYARETLHQQIPILRVIFMSQETQRMSAMKADDIVIFQSPPRNLTA